MSSADLATVVIACPHCATRYQVPWGTLGTAGREVQCAQCGKSWHAMADEPVPPAIDPDTLFDPAEEAALDAAFETEAVATEAPKKAALPAAPADPEYERTLAEIRAAIAPKPKANAVNALDPKVLKQAEHSFDRRQRQVTSKLPLARFRRTARLGAFVALISLLLLGFSLRIDIVRLFPSLAGLYATIGMPVNVVGLAFEDSKTVTALREGKTVMQITAKLRSITNVPVSVPPVLVSLLNSAGGTVYEWTVAPQVAELEPGEVMNFSTEVSSPPQGAVRVRLTFTNRSGPAAPDAAKAL